jgi:hypothetical protein
MAYPTVSFRLNPEAHKLLKLWAGEGRKIGEIVSYLVFERQRRMEDKQKMQVAMMKAVEAVYDD